MPRDSNEPKYEGGTVQRDVAGLVAQRGYRSGWTTKQFIARQIAKLAEEVAEVALYVGLPGSLDSILQSTGRIARFTFDDRDVWQGEPPCTPKKMMEELADVQVVVFCLAEALAELAGESYDVVQSAVVKAATDAMRGRRK